MLRYQSGSQMREGAVEGYGRRASQSNEDGVFFGAAERFASRFGAEQLWEAQCGFTLASSLAQQREAAGELGPALRKTMEQR